MRVLRFGSVPPPPGATVDMGHPLANGLLILARPVGSVMIDVMRGVHATSAGGHAYGWRGSNSLSAGVPTYDGQTSGHAYTWHVRTALINTADTSRYVCQLTSTPNTYQFNVLYGYVSRTFESHTGISGFCARLTLGTLSTGDTSVHSVSVSRDPQRQTVGYFDGCMTSTGSGTGDWTAPGSLAYVGRANSGGQYGGVFETAALYNRVLTPTEIQWLHAEPYAMFVLERRVYYSIPSSFFRAFPRSRVIGTGVYAQ